MNTATRPDLFAVAKLELNATEIQALMGLVMDKRRTLTPGNERSATFYAELDQKLSHANIGLILERFADYAVIDRANERLWRQYLKAIAQGDRLSELTISRKLFQANFRQPT